MNDLRTWDAWRDVHQPFELDWWRQALANGHDGMPTGWDEIQAFIRPEGKVLDIGCGPHPAFAPCTVIEPLALDYQKFTPLAWWEGVEVCAVPAEKVMLRFCNFFDTIVCWNCIDHTVGWKIILDNMLIYGNKLARFAIATDFFPPFTGHPGFDRSEFMQEIDKRFVVIDKREPLERELALLMVVKT